MATRLPAVPAELAARGVSLRAERPDDVDFVRDVYVAYRWEELAAAPWPVEARLAFLHDQFRLQHAQYHAHYPGAAFGIIEVDGARGGRLYAMHRDAELRIMDIALLPAVRGLGIGGALIGAVQDQARAVGARVTIHVERTNPAQRLYARLGFAHVADNGVYQLLAWEPNGLSRPGPSDAVVRHPLGVDYAPRRSTLDRARASTPA